MFRIKHVLNNIRILHTSSVVESEFRAMKKILKGPNKKKHRYSDAPTLPSPNAFSKGTHEGSRSVSSKRAAVLNKLFMRYITDLMATGESSSAFSGFNIEINRVQVTPDFKAIHVFWLAKGTDNDEAVEKVLTENCGNLRHELSQLKVIGVVPRIRFLKDKQYSRIMELDLKLAKADFGEDYVPTDAASKLKSQLQLYTKLSPKLQEQIDNLNDADNEEFCEPPEMFNCVFGLDHTRIMDKIMKNMNVNSLTQEKGESISLAQTTNENPIIIDDSKSQRTALKQFLFKRQLLKSKMSREDKNYQPELQMLHEEWRNSKENLPLSDFDFHEDNDYIEDDFK